jgi:hypothetical protein
VPTINKVPTAATAPMGGDKAVPLTLRNSLCLGLLAPKVMVTFGWAIFFFQMATQKKIDM